MTRPCWLAALCWCTGVAVGLADRPAAAALVVPLWFSLAYDGAGSWRRPSRAVLWPVVLLMLAGGLTAQGHLRHLVHVPPALAAVAPARSVAVTVAATVVRVQRAAQGVDVFVRAEPASGIPGLLTATFRNASDARNDPQAGGRDERLPGGLAGLPDPARLLPGDRIVVAGTLQPTRAARNPFDFDERRHRLAQGSAWRLDRPQLLAVEAGPPSPARTVAALRRHVLERARAHLPPDVAGLVAALLVGERADLSPETLEAFRRSGVMHLLAVSGLHVGLLAGLVNVALGRLLPQTKRRWPALVVVLAGFAAMTGLRPPVMRAALFCALALAAPLFKRPVDPLNLIGLVLLAILVPAPLLLYDVGLRMSVVAVVGIVVMTPVLQQWLPQGLPRWLNEGLAAGIAAQAALLPILAAYDFGFAWLGPLATVLVLPLLTLLLLAAMLWAMLGAGGGVLAQLLSGAQVLIGDALLQAVRLLAAVGDSWRLPVLPAWSAAAYYGILCAFLADWRHPLVRLRRPVPASRRRLAAAAGLLAVLALAVSAALQPRGFELIMLDVGQADALVLGAPGGAWAVVDAGWTGRQVNRFLSGRGVRSLQWLALTHADRDHDGGAAAVLEAYPQTIVLTASGHELTADAAERLHPGQWRLVAAGDRFALGAADIRVLSPTPALQRLQAGDRNAQSLVMQVVWGDWRVLLTGDATAATEHDLLVRVAPLLQADVLKVGHHGSRTSTTPAFLAAVDPQLALISVGAHNRYGLPDPQVAAQLEAAAQTLRTDRDGAIWLRFRPGAVDITVYRPDGPVRWRLPARNGRAR